MKVSRLDLSCVYDPFCRRNERMIMKVCGRDWMLKIGKRKLPDMLEWGLNLSEAELVITLATWGVDSEEPPMVIWEFTNAWVLDKKLKQIYSWCSTLLSWYQILWARLINCRNLKCWSEILVLAAISRWISMYLEALVHSLVFWSTVSAKELVIILGKTYKTRSKLRIRNLKWTLSLYYQGCKTLGKMDMDPTTLLCA